MESKASLNMPTIPRHRVMTTPFWLDLFFVSVATRLFLELNVGTAGHSVKTLQAEPKAWLALQALIYAFHLISAYGLLPTFLRQDYPKATLLWGSLMAWLCLPPMMPTVN